MPRHSYEINGVTVHWDDEEMTEAEAMLAFAEASMLGALSGWPGRVTHIHLSLHHEERARREARRQERSDA